jgi:hypothetical protein
MKVSTGGFLTSKPNLHNRKQGRSLLFPRPPERGNSQVEKDHNDEGCHPEGSLLGAAGVAATNLPELRSKDDYRQKKEHAGDFKPQNTSYTPERPQKPTDALGKATCSLSGSLTNGPAAHGRVRHRLGLGHAGGGLRAGSQLLARNAPGDAQSNSQCAPDNLRSHSVMMVAATLTEMHFSTFV